jgi:starch phosphorylase
MHLLMRDLPRALRLLSVPCRSNPARRGGAVPGRRAKRIVQVLFQGKGQDRVGERIAYLDDYDMELAGHLVAGCDLWLNLPRPPFEATGRAA